MVAYTTPDCLPFFEGTDSPCLNTGTTCEPSTVWCDFATLVEARLDTFDEVVARTATSTPIAWVETTTPFVYTHTSGFGVDLLVPFDTVRIDTDDMVNLDFNTSGFTVNRSGLYVVFGYTLGLTATSGGAPNVELLISFSPTEAPFGSPIINTATNMDYTVDDILIGNNIHQTIPLVAGQLVQMTVGGASNPGDTVTFSKASLGIAWTGDIS